MNIWLWGGGILMFFVIRYLIRYFAGYTHKIPRHKIYLHPLRYTQKIAQKICDKTPYLVLRELGGLRVRLPWVTLDLYAWVTKVILATSN